MPPWSIVVLATLLCGGAALVPCRPRLVPARRRLARESRGVARFGTDGGTNSAEETTRKWGLEAGLWQTFRSGGENKGEQMKELFQKYGAAYLITSISLALVSFSICYLLVDNGIDVGALLKNVGIDFIPEKAGTAAIAYAAHKAASPIRFPPTVALTPLVASALNSDAGEASRGVDGGDPPSGPLDEVEQ